MASYTRESVEYLLCTLGRTLYEAAHEKRYLIIKAYGIFGQIERFSKPNFGSIRRFRTMTGLEIEN